MAAVKAAGVTAEGNPQDARGVSKLTDEAKGRVDKLQHLLEHEANGDIVKHAKYFRDKVDPGDGGAARGRRRASKRSCRTTSGRFRRTGNAVRQVTDVDGPQAALLGHRSEKKAPAFMPGLFLFEPTRTAAPYVQGT